MEAHPKEGWAAIGVVIVPLLCERFSETLLDAETLRGLYALQTAWLDAAGVRSPLGASSAFLAALRESDAHVVLRPVAALWATVLGFFDAGGFASLVQLGVGAAAITTLNLARSARSAKRPPKRPFRRNPDFVRLCRSSAPRPAARASSRGIRAAAPMPCPASPFLRRRASRPPPQGFDSAVPACVRR